MLPACRTGPYADHTPGFAAGHVSQQTISDPRWIFEPNSVSETVTAIINHRLGKAEAIRRLKNGFASTNGKLGAIIAMEEETWEGDTLRFRMRALGQSAAGSIQVLEDTLRIEVSLPSLLAQAAKRLLPILRKQATLLLEKK